MKKASGKGFLGKRFLGKGFPRSTFALALALGASTTLFSPVAKAEALVKTERNCSLVMEGEAFNPGDLVGIYGVVKSAERKLAVVKIGKVKDLRSSGKVISGKKNCKRLPGGFARLEGGKESIPALDFVYMGGMTILGTVGMHQDATKVLPALTLITVANVSADIYPMAFAGSKGIVSGLGFGGEMRMSRIQPDLTVTGPDGKSEAGKQQILPQFIKADGIMRFNYLNRKMVTELRAGYLFNKLVQKVTKQGTVLKLPLRASQYVGFSVGAKQRYIAGNFRLTAGFTFGVGLSGVSDNMVVRQPTGALVAVKSPSAIGFEGGVDYRFGKFKIALGASYMSFGSNIALIDKTAAKLGEAYTFVGLGLGVVL